MAAAELLLEVGARRLRSAAIAERAGITESTLFRNFGSLEDVLVATEQWCWTEVKNAVSKANFDAPTDGIRQTLLRDTSAIWNLRSSPTGSVAAYCAFLFLRRKQEFSLNSDCEPQIQFESRLQGLCRAICQERGLNDDGKARLLSTLILNYMATVWFTWLTMPVGSEDITDNHDLTINEAQLGVLLLIDRDFVGGADDLGKYRAAS
jgi:AcrR family transcriptional regulator